MPIKTELDGKNINPKSISLCLFVPGSTSLFHSHPLHLLPPQEAWGRGQWGLGSDHRGCSLPLPPRVFPLLQHVSLTQAVKLQDKVAPVWALHFTLPQGIFTFSRAESPRECRLGVCSGTVLYGLQGNTCFNMACPTSSREFLLQHLQPSFHSWFPGPWSRSCFSHFFPHTDLWHFALFWTCFP